MSAEEFKVDYKQIFVRSREEIKRDKMLFAQAKAKLSEFVPKTDAQHAYLLGLSRQKATYPAYRRISQKNDSELTQNDLQNFVNLTNQLAESSALQAKFFRAARLHTSQAQRAEYIALGNAVKLRRFAHPCPKTIRVHAEGLSAKGVSSSTRQAILEVYLAHEQREVIIFKCFKCKELFAEYKN